MEIIVMTCDKFQWVLPVFFHLFKKFWPDCPWPVTVVGGPALESNLDSYSVYRSDDSVWCDLLMEYLEPKHDDDLVCIFCEDYVVMGYVDTKVVNRCLRIIRADPRVQLMRLNAVPGPTLPWGAEGIGEFDKDNAPYLSSLVPCIWRVGHLRRLIEPGWTAWDVEILGTPKARRLPGIYLGFEKIQLIPCHNYLIRGELNPAAAEEVQRRW